MQYEPITQRQDPEKVPWGLWLTRGLVCAVMICIVLLMTEKVIPTTETTYVCNYDDFTLVNETACMRNDSFCGLIWEPAVQIVTIQDNVEKISTIFWLMPLICILFTGLDEVAFRRMCFTLFLIVNGIFLHLDFKIFLYVDLLLVWFWFCYTPFLLDKRVQAMTPETVH